MQFMLALIAEERSWEDVTPDEVKKNLAEMGQFNAELTEAGAWVTGGGLQERATGTTVHYSDERAAGHRRPLRRDQGAALRLLDRSTSRASTTPLPGRRRSRCRAATSKSGRW